MLANSLLPLIAFLTAACPFLFLVITSVSSPVPLFLSIPDVTPSTVFCLAKLEEELPLAICALTPITPVVF